ncbi:MAG: SMP-30/gluconolactonase/LRE family protein [Planctomycetota bacterium]|jgi:gluconolactonase|nr:SMP-30/gluconolactonase/LRE family protein [Planctomycetota bacterium]
MKHCLILAALLLAPLSSVDLSAQIKGIGPVGAITRAHTGFQFTEGPAASPAGTELYFSDVRANKIHKVDSKGRLRTFVVNTQNTNGLMFDRRGRLIACEGGAGRLISIDIFRNSVTPLASFYNGKRFNKPNDLTIDVHGGIYFTDPVFGNTVPSQPKMGVYYHAPNGKTTLVIDPLVRPNGIILSPDERTLYVVANTPTAVHSYPVTSPGKLGRGKVFYQWNTGNCDGMTVDTAGNVYVTRPQSSAIEVLSPVGQSLGTITFPENPANVTFGGADMKTLWVTARTSVYRAKMLATGHRPMRLTATANTIKVSGGKVTFTLHGGIPRAGLSYAILGGASGTEPGVLAGGVRLPLNPDNLTLALAGVINSPPFANFAGSLDASGTATATMTLPPLGAGAIGLKFDFAGLTAWPTDATTNALRTTMVR